MKQLFTLFITLTFLISIVPIFSYTHAATTVHGLITSDTVWNQGNTYTLTGPVGIPQGVTLTIEPGVTVNFAAYYIQVNGTLNAQGTGSKNIIFTSSGYNYQSSSNFQNLVQFMETSTDWNDKAASGCIIQNTRFNTVGTTVTNAAPKLSQNTYNYSGMTIYSGSPTITYNEFDRSSLTTYGSGTVSNNYFKGGGTAITASSTVYISDNVIDDYSTGTTFWGEVTFTHNTVTNCDVGIASDASSVTLTENYICNNGYGIKGGGDIESNTIMNNTVGMQLAQSGYLASITLKDNNIYNNTQYNLIMDRSSDVDATNNYWGTSNAGTIDQTIRDASEDFSLGQVTYQPFLSSPSSSAPAAPATGLMSGWELSLDSEQFKGIILDVAQILAITLSIGWIVAIVIFRIRKRRKRKSVNY